MYLIKIDIMYVCKGVIFLFMSVCSHMDMTHSFGSARVSTQGSVIMVERALDLKRYHRLVEKRNGY